MVIFGLSALLHLALTPALRRHFRNPRLYAAMLLAPADLRAEPVVERAVQAGVAVEVRECPRLRGGPAVPARSTTGSARKISRASSIAAYSRGLRKWAAQRRGQPPGAAAPTGPKIHHGVLGQQPAGRGAGQQPPAPPVLAGCAPIRIQRQRPEQEERHVVEMISEDSDTPAAAGSQGAPEGDARIEQAPRQRPDQQGDEGVEQQGAALDAERPLAAHRGGQGDQRGDHRRLGVIAPLQVLRPGPVLRFVQVQVEAVRSTGSGRGSGDQRQQDQQQPQAGGCAGTGGVGRRWRSRRCGVVGGGACTVACGLMSPQPYYPYANPYELLTGLRYTRAKRRNHFISFISATSMICIGLGVHAIVCVVMNGFERSARPLLAWPRTPPSIGRATGSTTGARWPSWRPESQGRGHRPLHRGRGHAARGRRPLRHPAARASTPSRSRRSPRSASTEVRQAGRPQARRVRHRARVELAQQLGVDVATRST